MHECLSEGELTLPDIETMHNFKGSHNHTLNEVGLHLKIGVSSIVDLYKSFLYDPVKELVSSPSGNVPGVNFFLGSFVNNYTNNEEFCASLLTSLCKAYSVKVDGVPNPRNEKYVLKVFLELSASGDKKAFEFVSGNLCGASFRRMQMIAEKRSPAPLIRLFCNEIIDMLLARISRICTSRKDPKSRFALTSGIDATALMKAY